MIATHTCSTQLRRFAATKLVRSNTRRSLSLFTGSLASPLPFPSPSSRLIDDEVRRYSNTNRHTYQPMGDLYQQAKKQRNKSSILIGGDFVGKTASIRRVFGPDANAQALLTCGGEELAQRASFDPDYETAKGWIRSQPVGPAVLSSTLISGLVGALIEASFPQTVPVNSSMTFLHPLIVGMEIAASIRVESVCKTKRDGNKNGVNGGEQNGSTNTGYEILLSTQVTRVQDDVKIAEGHHTVWIPGYL